MARVDEAVPDKRAADRDQDQFDVRLDHRLLRDQLFGRLSHFQGRFGPVTPLPDGSGTTTGTLGPQETASWAFASSYQRMFSDGWLNELRIGDTRRHVTRTDGLMGQIRLRIGDQTLTAVITADAIHELKLRRGDDALALIKSTEVMVAREAPEPSPTRRPRRRA